MLPDLFRNSFFQHDSSEFGRIFLDELERSLKDTNDKVINFFCLTLISFHN